MPYWKVLSEEIDRINLSIIICKYELVIYFSVYLGVILHLFASWSTRAGACSRPQVAGSTTLLIGQCLLSYQWLEYLFLDIIFYHDFFCIQVYKQYYNWGRSRALFIRVIVTNTGSLLVYIRYNLLHAVYMISSNWYHLYCFRCTAYRMQIIQECNLAFSV